MKGEKILFSIVLPIIVALVVSLVVVETKLPSLSPALEDDSFSENAIAKDTDEPLPDLIIDWLGIRIGTCTGNETYRECEVWVEAVIKNVGDAWANNTNTLFAVVDDGGNYDQKIVPTSDLEPGEFDFIRFVHLEGFNSTLYTLTVAADNLNQINEIDENNNVRTFS